MKTIEMIVVGAYVVGAGALIWDLIRKSTRFQGWGLTFLGIGFFADTWLVGLHTVTLLRQGQFPFSGPAESFSTLAWVLCLLTLIVFTHLRIATLAALLAPLCAMAALLSVFLPARGEMLAGRVPPWLFGAHVVVLSFGIGCFCLAFLGGLVFLIQQRELKSKKLGVLSSLLPSLEVVDRLVVQALVAGFVFLTAGIVSGIGLAHGLWSKEWFKDPKFISSSLTWIWYLVLLSVRYRLGWRGARFFFLIVIGFIFLLTTFLGFALYRSPSSQAVSLFQNWSLWNSLL